MDQDRLQKIKIGQLLDVIRERPAMYLGKRSLTALSHFLAGYGFALRVHEIPSSHHLPGDFHDWVAYRLHFFESTSGYANMILKRVPDESSALDRFFELLDEHRVRQPRIVATVKGHRREYKTSTFSDGVKSENVSLLPETLTLVAYTEDPGFFVSSDDPTAQFPRRGSFSPTLKWFGQWYGVHTDNMTILDPNTFNRWLTEEDRFKKSSDTATNTSR